MENLPEDWDRIHQANILYERILKAISGNDLDIIELALAKIELDLYKDEEPPFADETLNGYHG